MKKFFTTNCKKTALAFLAMFFCLMMRPELSFGQTPLISASDGGFETGAIFAANGWTVVNPTSNNSWYVGTATKSSGSNSAYIASDGVGTTNSYDNTSARTAHFYRDITVPAGATNINLSFQLKSVGEGGYDRLLVYTAPTSVTPVRNVPASNSTTLTGATLIYTQPTATFSSYTNVSVTLPNSLAGTVVRLIFTWQNDNSGGSNPPASVDNISLTYLQTYIDQFSNLSTNATTAWCPGETRSVSVTVKNNGTATWVSNASTGVNFSYWWTAGQNRDFNARVLPFTSLAPGASQVVTTNVTAPNTAGTYALNFDLVKEGSCWFGDNVTNCSGPGNVVFATSNITVNALPSITGQSTPAQTKCQGVAASAMSVTTTGTGLVYQWYSNTIASASGGTPVGTNSPNYTPLTTTAGTLYYYCVVSGTCPPAATSAVSGAIVVNANPTVNAGGVVAAICQGGTTAALGGSFGGGATAAVWSDGGAGGIFANNTGSTPGTTTYTASATAPASVTLTLTTSGGSCATTSANKLLTVNANPTVNAGGAVAAICQGGTTAALGGSFGGGATAAVWSDGGAGGIFANNTGSTPGTTTYTASATAPASVTLTLTTSGGSCATTSANKLLTVNANPTVNAGGAVAAICQGGTTAALGGSFGGGATAAVWSDGGAGGIFANNTGSTPGTTTYTASATAPASVTLTLTTSGGSCATTSANKLLTVNANPTVNAGGAVAAICQGGTTAALGGSFGGGATAAVWSDGGAGGIFANNTGSTPGTTTYTASATAPASVTLTLMTSGGSCGTPVASKILTVYQSVTITSNPGPASTTLCTNGTINYTVTATGSNLTYQWLFNGSPITNGGDFSGANTATLSITGADPTDAGNYSVSVSGSSPCTSVTSTPVSLTVNQNIGFTPQPAANTALCPGQTFTISTTVTGTVTISQWYKNGSPYTAVPGSVSGNTYTLSIPGITAADAGSYKLFVDDGTGTGCPSAFSAAAVLTVNNSTTTTNPVATQTVCQNGTSTNLSVTGSGSGTLTYQWFSNITNSNIGGTAIGGATSSTFTPSTTTSGTLYYYVEVTGTCGTVKSATSTVNVTATNTAGTPSATPTVCINTAIAPNITITTTGATGIGAPAGLPAGVSAAFASNTITISGTPTASGTFNYSIPLTGGCGAVNATGTITVTANNTVGSASSNPTLCINTAIAPNITFATTGATGIGTATGLPAGVTATFASNTITISGTPTASGPFSYSIPLTGGCGSVSATGTINVTANNTVTAGTTTTLCINTAISPVITHTTTGATGIGTPTGLPTGVSASFASNKITISGTPTASGTFNYSIPLTGGCGAVNATGTITVTANNTVGSASSNPTLCINTAIAPNITFATTGATGIGTATGLPAGVTATFASNTITISGTPTASGPFSYSIPLTGGCGSVSATGTINVTANNTVTAGTTTTLCINTAISPVITHTTTGATGIGTPTGLPTGVSASFASNKITISGTPSVSGTFNYIIPLTGGCGTVSATGTIIVNANNTAGAPSSNPTLCINTAIAPNITFATTGATGIGTATGLPAGVTATFASNTITISGTPTASGPFSYSIPLTGGCAIVNATGSITVTPANTISLTSAAATTSQSICIGASIINITYSTTGATGATFSGLPGGVTGSLVSNVVTISGTPTATGSFSYTVNLTGGCGNVSASGSVTVNALPTAPTSPQNLVVCQGGGGTIGVTTQTQSTGSITVTFSSIPAQPSDFGNAAPGGIISTATMPALPAGAVVTSASLNVPAINPRGTSWQSDTYLGITGAVADPAAQGTGAANNNNAFNYTRPVTPSAINVAGGTVNLIYWNDVDDVTGADNNFNSSTGTLVINYSVNASVKWYNTATGGTVQGNGNPFNPVGTTVLPNTNTVGTYNFYAEATSPAGCSSSSRTLVTVTVNPTLANNTVAAPQTICSGSAPAGLTGTLPTGGNGTYIYLWESSTTSATSGFAAASGTNNNQNYTPGTLTQTTWYRRTVTSGGCTDVSAAVQITVNPVIANNTIAATQTICSGTTPAPLTGTTPTGGNGTYTYLWASSTTSATTGFAAASGTNNAQNYTPGILTQTTWFRRVVNSGACNNTSAAIQITITAVPAGTFTATENSGTTPNDNIICAGDAVTFHAPAGYGAYSFYVNGSLVQGPNLDSTYSTSSISSGAPVTVVVANSFNCATTFGPVSINVVPVPTPTLMVNPSTPVCPGTNITFTAGGGTSYNFKVNGSSVQSSSSNTYSSTTLNNGDVVTVDVSNANGCIGTSAPVTVAVNTLPSGTLTATENSGTANDNKICAGSSVTFTATTGFTTYNFKINGVSVVTGSSNTYTTTGLTNGQVVSVDVTNAGGCTATFGPPQSITVYAIPTGSVAVTENSGTPNDSTICPGSSVTFTATAGYSNYAFYLNGTGAALYTGSSNVYSTSSLATGNYLTATVMNVNGCSATFTSNKVTVVPVPAGSLIASTNPVCKNTNVDFTASSGFANYNFKVNGISVQNGTSNVYSSAGINNGDVITVDVSNSQTCLATFNSVTMTVTALPSGTLTAAENSGTTPNDGKICTGATVVFTATGGFTNYNFKINGITAPGGYGTSNTYTTSSLANGDSVSVEVTSTAGCIGPLNSIIITVSPYPVVAAISGPSSVCANTTIALTDASTSATNIWSSSDNTIATVNAATGVVTGAGAGTVTISYTITNANGCSSIATKNVTVYAAPVVNAISGPSQVCTGSNITLTETTTGGTWSSSDNTKATVDGSGNVTGVNSGNVVINYTVTNSNSCTTAATKNITVNAIPVVAAITPAAPHTVCGGSSIQLSDATTGGTWSTDNTLAATVDNTGKVTGNTGNGTVIVNIIYTVTNAANCTTTVSTPVTVYDIPVPTLTGPNPICPNATDVYNTEAGQFNYQWTVTGGTINSGGTSTDNTITVTWDQPGTRTIKVNYANANGCTGATSATLTTSTGTVPTLSGNNVLCLNSSGTYTTQSGETNYVWTPSAGTITAGGTATDNTATVTWTASGDQTISVNFTDVNGCTNATPTVYPVTVRALPTATIAGTAAVCQGSTAPNVTFTGANGTAPYTFTYTINGGANQVVTTTSGNSVTVAAPTGTNGTFTYTLVSVAGQFCSQAQTGSAVVTVNPTPTVVINNPAAVCSPSTVDITAAAITAGSTSGVTYTYYTDAAGTTVYNTPTAATAGTYYIKGSTASGCYQIKPVTVTVNPTPTVVITNPAAVCSPSTVNITTPAVTAGSTSGLTYTYYTDAAATTVYNTPTAATAGTYYIKGSTASGCYQIKPVTVTVNPTPTVVINNPAAVCSPSTVDITAAAITAGSTSGVTYTYYTDAAGTTVYNTPTAATAGTYYIKGSTASGCYQIKPVTVTVNPAPTVVITNPAAVCSPSTVNITTPAVTAGSTSGLTYTYYTDAAATTVYNTPTAATAGTYYIKGSTASGCYQIKPVTVTVNPLPVVSAPASVCVGSTINVSPSSGGTWTSSNNTVATITNAGIVTGQSAGSGVTFTFTQTSTGCSSTTSSLTVYTPPPAPTVTPSSATVCQGNIQSLYSGVAPVVSSSTGSYTGAAIPIPDNSATGAVSTVTVSGIPAGAVINSINVTFNITHTYDGDLRINIKAPNANVLNLVDREGGSGQNFVNTIISSTSSTPLVNAPFTGTFAPDGDATNGATAGGGNNPNVSNFAGLSSIPNGTWQLSARDVSNNDVGTIGNWSVTINYSISGTPQTVTWSPATDLYTDAAATTPYTAGTSQAIVYAKPATSGSRTYMATATNAANCSTSTSILLNVVTSPTVSITADYCAFPGQVVLTATHTTGSTLLWNTGKTTDTIHVDVAGIYKVTATNSGGCSITATINVANELIYNGNFEAGNVGFTSSYPYRTGAGSLNNPPGYAVDTAANYYGPSFLWGKDHTTTHGKFMMVNGAAGANYQIWQQTISVLPNTTYYFSAWGLELDNLPSPPTPANAQLQFNVNGAQVGTFGNLPRPNNPQTDADNNGWVRFYGTWTSGPAVTSAVVSITDLQGAVYGNNFGLDDISFSTLSTFVNLVSNPGTDAQTVCVNTAIQNIVYSAGSSASQPTITGLPSGVTASWNGVYLTISGTPTLAGNYSYTVTTTGSCQPASASGTITVQGQKATVTSGSATQTVCVNSPVTSIVYTISGTGSGAIVKGLPSGVAGVYNTGAKTFTISGTPTVTGIFKDTVITTGTCKADTAYGTITVQNQTITISSGSSNQTACINTGITSVIYSLGGTATGASVTSGALPAGVTGFVSGTSYIISGTPTAAGTFIATITTSGTCSPGAVIKDTITVSANATITLTSAVGSDALATCDSVAMTPVTYAIGGSGNNASITSGALPAGVTGVYNNVSGIFTISGTPTALGIFNYTITATGTCGTVTKSGSITVQKSTLVLTSGTASPTQCLGSALTNIVFTYGGSATGITMTGAFPAGVTGALTSGNTYTISGSATALGTFTYTLTTTGGCNTGTVPASVTGTITVNNGSVGGTVTPTIPSICSGSGGVLNLTGNTGNVVRWESSVNGGSSWTIIANTTTTLNYTAITVPTQYRALVKSGSCNGVYSSVASVNIHNYWTGGTSTDWNTASNWSDNQVPSTSCPDVFIQAGTYQPILGSGTVTITNLHVQAGGNLTINGTGTLQIAGTISNSGIFDVTAGTVELNGTSAQAVPSGTFTGNAIKNLVISNTAGVSLGGQLDVYGSLTYNKSGAALNTGGNLTLKSTISQTAWVGDMTSHTINGAVTVERYIATGLGSAPNHGKSWQLLAVPTQGQTIKQSWQEGATATNVSSPAPLSQGNLVPGYGTMITSDVAGAATQPTPGFDALTAPGPSMKVYDYATGNYIGPASTSLPVYNQKGYFTFVRGDRSVAAYNQSATPTILRTKGTLFTPANLPPVTTVLAGKFESVGNPYAAPVDIRNVTLGGGTQKIFIVWDPRLGGTYNYGAFQYIAYNPGTGNYEVSPGGGSYGAGGTVNNYVQSGQAFLVQAFGSNGTVTFSESAKAGNATFTSIFTRQASGATVTTGSSNQQGTLRTSLNTVNADGSTKDLVDGVLDQFDDSYSNTVDGLDARKTGNTGENLSVKTTGTLLAIERRHTVVQDDTIHLNLTGERVQQYRYHFEAQNMSTTAQGFVIDNYKQTRTPLNLNGATDYDFSVENVAGSYAPDRFMVVFSPLKALPVTFTSIKAYKQDKNIDVEWRVSNENNIKQYQAEKSENGKDFTLLATQKPTNNNGGSAVYTITDTKPVTGNNYYRIRSVDVNGAISYTTIVNVEVGEIKQEININPNPITDGQIHLQFENEPAGKYGLRLLNSLGQIILAKQVTRQDGTSTELIRWDFNLAHGLYKLEVTKPDGDLKIINVLY